MQDTHEDEEPVLLADAPCDEPGCKKPWAKMVRLDGEKVYLCAEHAEKERHGN